jgi:hypothetical protein
LGVNAKRPVSPIKNPGLSIEGRVVPIKNPGLSIEGRMVPIKKPGAFDRRPRAYDFIVALD